MPAISGKYACVKDKDGTEIEEVTGWEYRETGSDPSYASCKTKGQRKRVEGDYDITGTVRGVYNDEASFRSVVKRGKDIVLHLYRITPDEDADPPIVGLYDKIPARILDIDTSATIDGGGPQPWSFTFGLSTTDADPVPLFGQSA